MGSYTELKIFNLAEHLYRQREWSAKTFGPMKSPSPGTIDHIRKELSEIEQDWEEGLTSDEWVDVIILAFDGFLREGYEPEAIIRAVIAKQEKNERRQWPDWRTATPGKAIEHVKGVED